MPALQLIAQDLALSRGARTILDGVSFTVAAGEALLLTGRNGAGKTTLVRALAGFLRPSHGAIRLQGGGEELELAEQSHYVGHLNGIKPALTVEENLTFWADYLEGGTTSDLVQEAMDRLGLGSLAQIPAGYLSAGQKRRAGLARLLVARRPVWLLDEPTVSLDAAATAVLAGIVNAHVAGGGLVVAATHLPLGLARPKELRLGGAAADASPREDAG